MAKQNCTYMERSGQLHATGADETGVIITDITLNYSAPFSALSSTLVTLCAARFKIHRLYVLPTQCIYVFVWISEQTAIISLYNNKWLVFKYNRDGMCLLRGANFNFNVDSG
jgi:hypothetical protein